MEFLVMCFSLSSAGLLCAALQRCCARCCASEQAQARGERERERTMHTSSPAPLGCHRVTLCFQTRQEPFTAAPPAAHGGVLSPQSANPERLPRRLQSSAATSKTTQSTPAKSKKQLPPRRSGPLMQKCKSRTGASSALSPLTKWGQQ